MVNVGSLFSGIGGLDLGLERAGMRVVWQCESDPYARAVLRKHWPDVPCYEDVRKVGANNAVRVDLICGGFPCQDISIAGKQAGLSGERSGLWFQFSRIIGEFRPTHAIIESTPPFRRWVPVVRSHLRSMGYASVPIYLHAADVGAPHLRKRVFVLANADRDAGWLQSWRAGGSRGADQAGTGDDGATQPLAVANGAQRERRRLSGGARQEHSDSIRSGWWEAEPDVGRVAYGVPSWVDRLRCLGNAVVPQVAEYIGRLILAHAEEA